MGLITEPEPGKPQEVEGTLVPGDFVRVRPGDIVSADIKLRTGTLSLDESALTGESKDADKIAGDVLSSGSVVRRGEGDGVVTLIGAKTSFGRTTQLVQEAHPKLHIEEEIAKVVRWLFLIVATLLCLVIVLSLLLTAMGDFSSISLAADHVRPSKKPETWQIGGFVFVSVVLGFMMLAEAFLALWIGRSYFGLANHQQALYTFSFLLLLYFNVFSVVSTRERRWFWSTRPSRILLAALAANAVVSTGLTFVGFPDLVALPWWQALAIFLYVVVACLLVNDAVKVAMIKWQVPSAAA